MVHRSKSGSPLSSLFIRRENAADDMDVDLSDRQSLFPDFSPIQDGTGMIDNGIEESCSGTTNEPAESQSCSGNSIRSSVLHNILDNEPSLLENHDKIKFTRLYKKYDKNESDENDLRLEFTDFQQYNRLLHQEDKLRSKLEKIARLKGLHLRKDTSQGPQENVLTTLNDDALNALYINAENPKDWDEMEKAQRKREGESKWMFGRLLHKFINSSESSKDNKEKDNSDELDFISIGSSIPIDDDVQLEDLPIDSQPFRKVNKRTLDYLREFEEHQYNNDNEIEMVVSKNEKVDYNLHRVDQYQNIDPIESPTDLGDHWISKTLNYFNLLRIMRIQRANKYQIQRKLNVRHLNQIALGGTLGVGLLLASGKAFTIAGPFGCLLGFIIAGALVIATMLSFCEIVTLIPLCGGVSGVAARFIDDGFGFALGVLYWVTYLFSFSTEVVAASIMLSYYDNLHIPGPNTAGWITLFLGITVIINLLDIRVYGEFEYYSTIIKLVILLALMIYMIVLNTGHSGPLHQRIGFKYWDSSLSDVANNITFGLFRPTFDVDDNGLGSLHGIGGNLGRFLQVLVSCTLASFAYVGTEIVIITGSESVNPRRSIPSATKNIFLRIIVFYIIAIFLVGLNIYSGDPRLLRFYPHDYISESQIAQQDAVVKIIGEDRCKSTVVDWAGFVNGSQSPWVIAIQSAGLCSFASAVNAFLLYFALTSASSQLYVSSRTLYFLALQNKIPSCFSLCTKRGVPYVSVLFTAFFGLLSYLSVKNDTAVIFERLMNVCSTSGLLVWCGMCLSFIRFYHALKLRPDIISRDDDDYPYRSPFQPYLAYMGLFTGLVLVISSGFTVFLKGKWSTSFFFSSYGSLILFFGCYIAYWIFRGSKVTRLDQVDLDSGRREIDRVIWEDEKNYASNFKERLRKGIRMFV